MSKIYFIIMTGLISLQNLFAGIEISSPLSNTKLCSSESLIIKCNNNEPVFIMARTVNTGEYSPIAKGSISENEFEWIVNDLKYLNQPIDIMVINSTDLNDYDEIKNITIFQETKILSQTQSAVYCQNENVNLYIDAKGYNLKYQWYRDGFLLKNENKSILNLPNLQFENSGIYHCEIVGELNCNSIKSNPIAVYIAVHTEITEQPQHIGLIWGQHVKFTVGAHINGNGEDNDIKFQWYKGSEPFKDTISIYQFYKNKWRIVGSQTPILEILFTIPSDQSDSIYCVVTGRCGSAKSKMVKLKENAFFKYKILTPIIDKCIGDSAVLKIEVTQTEPGTLIYEWYRTGNRKVYDNERISGSNTQNLTIRNCNMEDHGTYYLRITHLESGYVLNTYPISFNPETDPNINPLISEYTVYDRLNGTDLYGVLRINVSTLFVEKYYFEWYCNDVLTFEGKDTNGYMVKISNPDLKYEGKWYCKVTGKCGYVFTDTCYVKIGYKDVYSCLGSDTSLTVRKHQSDTGQMKYLWYFKDKLIIDNNKFTGSETIKLSINSLNFKDEGKYLCYAFNEITKQKYYIGFVYLDVMQAPEIRKILLDTLIVYKNMPMEVYMTFLTESKTIIELYRDSTLYKKINFVPSDWGDIYFTISMCATDGDTNLRGAIPVLRSGTYRFHLINKCGDTWSKNIVLINRDEKKGIVKIPDPNSASAFEIINYEYKTDPSISGSEDSFVQLQTDPETGIAFNNKMDSKIIFPNPARDFIEINIDAIQPKHSSDNDEKFKIQIYNIFGILLSDYYLTDKKQRIKIEHLPSGVYFVKIGNWVEKFVKI